MHVKLRVLLVSNRLGRDVYLTHSADAGVLTKGIHKKNKSVWISQTTIENFPAHMRGHVVTTNFMCALPKEPNDLAPVLDIMVCAKFTYTCMSTRLGYTLYVMIAAVKAVVAGHVSWVFFCCYCMCYSCFYY